MNQAIKSATSNTQAADVKLTYMNAIVEAQHEEMQRDESVILMGEDIATYGGASLYETFGPKRVWNTPISENAFTGVAIGAAMTGLRPIVDLTMASFVYLASDQIINQAAKLRYMTGGQMQVPVVFRTCMYHGNAVAAQHSDRPYPMFMNVPGLKILVPSSAADMKGLMKSAIRDDDPVMIFEDVSLWAKKELVSTDTDELIPIGNAAIKHTGTDVTVIAIGSAVPKAVAAAKALEKEHISVEVIDPRTLVPLDKNTLINSVGKTGRCVIVDHAHRTGSAASEIAAVLGEEAFECLQKPIQRVATPDVQIPFSPVLELPLYPNKDNIIAAIRRVL